MAAIDDLQHPAEGHAQQYGQAPADAAGQQHQQQRRGDAGGAAPGRGVAVMVQAAVQPADQPSGQGDRMRQPPPQPGRVTDHGVEQQGRGQDPEMVGEVEHALTQSAARTAAANTTFVIARREAPWRSSGTKA